jgi:hypothetical protein
MLPMGMLRKWQSRCLLAGGPWRSLPTIDEDQTRCHAIRCGAAAALPVCGHVKAV